MFGTIICVCIPSRGNSSVFVLIIYPSWSPSSLIHVPAFISLSHFVASFSSSLTLWTALELINGPYYAGGKLLCAAVAFDVKDWLFLVSYNKRWRSNCTRDPDFLYGSSRSILKINNASPEKGHFSWRLRLQKWKKSNLHENVLGTTNHRVFPPEPVISQWHTHKPILFESFWQICEIWHQC